MILLLGIRHSRGDCRIILGGADHRLAAHRRSRHIAGAGNRVRLYGDALGTGVLRRAAHFPCHRRFGIIFTEKESGGRIDANHISRTRAAHGSLGDRILRTGSERILEISQDRDAAFGKAEQIFIRHIAADPFGAHRVRAVQLAVLVDAIFRRHRRVAPGMYGARHLRLCVGIGDANGSRQRQRASAVRHRRSELAHRGRGNLRISSAGNRSALAHLGRHITVKLCPAEIERRRRRFGAQKTALVQSEAHFIISLGADVHVLRRGKLTLVHMDVGVYVADAHIETKAMEPQSDRHHRRTSIRTNADVSAVVAAAQRFHLCIFHIHVSRRSDLRHRAQQANIRQRIGAAKIRPLDRGNIFIDRVPNAAFFRLDRDILLRRRLVRLSHFTGGRRAGCDFYILADHRISALAVLPHVNLRVGAVADVPGIEPRLGGGVNLHVPAVSGVNGAVVDSHPRRAHGIPHRGDLNVCAFTAIGLRRNLRRFDDEHAAILRLLRIRLPVCGMGRSGQRNLPAVGENLPAAHREILPFHGNMPAVRLRLAAHSQSAARRKEDAVVGDTGLRGALDA